MGNDTMELRWNEHGTNAPNTFKELWQDQDFADVTLATADDRQLKAHKVIISSCSPLFRNILIKNPHQNPVIYLKGVNYEHLENALKFIYLGRCDVRKDDILAFPVTGADLEITGLMQEPEEDAKVRLEVRPKKASLPDSQYYNADIKKEILSTNYPPNKAEFLATESQPGDEVRNPFLVSADDGRFRCNMCDMAYGKQSNLNRHKQAKHEGVRYGCNQCDYKANQQGSLNTHKQSQHEGVRYGCDQCDHKASTQSNLTTHKQSQHEGVRYDCDQCDHKATQQVYLTKHKRKIHYKES
jgi:hypothetical protein